LALAAAGCEGHPRVIGDGWHYGQRAAAQRAVRDSLLGLSAVSPSISYVGIDRQAGRSDLVVRASGGLTGESWANALIAMGPLSVVVGHPGSATTNSAARVYARAGIPLIAPNATAAAEPELERWIFRLLPDDATQGAFLASYTLDSLSLERVAVVFVGDAYGVGLLRGVRAEMARRGLPLADEVELPLVPCSADPTSPPRLAARALVKRSRPDAVIIALPLLLASCVLDEIVKAKPGTAAVAADALDLSDFDRWARSRIPGARVHVATGWRPRDDSTTRRFVETFARRNGLRPGGSEALLYDALLVAATALRETSGRPTDVRDWLASLGTSREPVQGITGDISFAADRNVSLYMRTVQ
jgi:ABC-type branched-subunit amino acid transport system substrate-binding protein